MRLKSWGKAKPFNIKLVRPTFPRGFARLGLLFTMLVLEDDPELVVSSRGIPGELLGSLVLLKLWKQLWFVLEWWLLFELSWLAHPLFLAVRACDWAARLTSANKYIRHSEETVLDMSGHWHTPSFATTKYWLEGRIKHFTNTLGFDRDYSEVREKSDNKLADKPQNNRWVKL